MYRTEKERKSSIMSRISKFILKRKVPKKKKKFPRVFNFLNQERYSPL